MAQVEVKFSEWFERGFEVYKKNFGVLVLASLVMVLLSMVSIGILAGPLTVGMALLVLRLVDGDPDKPDVGALFKGFAFFLPSFLFTLVWGLLAFVALTLLALVPCLGNIAGFALMLCLSTALTFGYFLMGDRGLDFWSASKESFAMVRDSFLPFLGLVTVAGLIADAGMLLCGIGMFFTIPVFFCVMAVAYRETLAQLAGPPAEEAEVAPEETVSPEEVDEPNAPPSA